MTTRHVVHTIAARGPKGGNISEAEITQMVVDEVAASPTVAAAAAAAVDANPVISRLKPGRGKIVVGNPDGDPVEQSLGGGYLPLRNVTLTERAVGEIVPIDAIGDTLYGVPRDGISLHRSTDDGVTWEQITASGLGSPNAVRQLGDGEVLVSGTGNLYRSTGWATNPLTATWTTVATVTSNGGANPGAAFIPFTLDVYDNYVLLGEYVVPDRTNSRYLRLSTDYGQTFTNLLDLNAMYPGDETLTHWHGVCIDRWADTPSGIRLWASHGDGPSAMLYSDDLGATFTTFTTEWQHTTLTATPAGIVGATDQAPDGVYRILRTPDPADMVHEPIHIIRRGGIAGSLYGFAQRAFYHEQTGLVYIAFRADQGVAPAMVLVSDGYTADEVYETPFITTTIDCQNISVVDGGSVHWWMSRSDTGVTYRAQGDQVARGGKTADLLGAGGQLTGTAATKTGLGIGGNVAAENDSVIIGVDATSGAAFGENVAVGHRATLDTDAYQSVVVGKDARARKHQAVAMGREADALDLGGTALGHQAVAYSNAVAVGNNAKSGQDSTTEGSAGVAIGAYAVNETANGGVAVGSGASVATGSNGGVAVGNNAAVTGFAGTAVGNGASAAGETVAIGSGASATGTAGIAIGKGAGASYEGSIAIGGNAVANDYYQFQVGLRYFEIKEYPGDPPAPAADNARLFVRDNGSGKTQLCVRFATGAVQVIATEP